MYLNSDDILRCAPFGIIQLEVIRDEGFTKVIEANLTFESLTGLQRDSLVGQRLDHIGARLNDDGLTLLDRRALQLDITSFEVFFHRTQRWCQIQLQSKETHVIAFLHEIIKKQPSAVNPLESLAKEEKKFQDLVIESIPGYFFVKDDQFRLMMINSTFRDLYPKEQQDHIIGSTTLEQYDSKEREEFLKMDRKAFEDGYSETEETITFPNGDRKIVLTKKIRFHNSEGQAFILGVSSDITDIKMAHQIIEKQNDQLKIAISEANALAKEADKANRAKSEFLANMTHEIRTPINGILGMNQVLQSMELGGEVKQCLNIISKCGDSLLTLINDILDLSKIEVGKMNIAHTEVHIKQILGDIRDTHQVRAMEKGLELSFQLEPNVPKIIFSDPNRLRQILNNLVSNAIKFTEKGSVTVSISQHSDQPESFDSIRFCVRDTGPGIPIEQQHLLFQQFSQLDGSTTRKYGGTGLGLAISKELCELLGGNIGIESEANKGANFWFSIPCHLPNMETKIPFPHNEFNTDNPYLTQKSNRPIPRILIVEDNLINRKVILKLLNQLGHPASVAYHGKEAIEALANNDFDLVLMDCQMPVMNGYETTRQIRDPNSPVRNHAIKVVALTGNAMQRDRMHCLNAGMDDYFTKPISKNVLSIILERWLPST